MQMHICELHECYVLKRTCGHVRKKNCMTCIQTRVGKKERVPTKMDMAHAQVNARTHAPAQHCMLHMHQ